MFNPYNQNPYGFNAPNMSGFNQTYNNGFNSGYMPQNQNMNTYTYVNGLEGAKAFIVPPRGTALLMDSDNPIFYLKTANDAGQANIRTFKFEEVTGQTFSPVPAGDFAQKTEFDKLKEKVENLEKLFSKEVKRNAESVKV